MKIYKGNIVFTETIEKFTLYENGYIVVDKNGLIKFAGEHLPTEYKDIDIIDFGEQLIIPGFTDSHVHASQMPNMGIAYNKELIPWLNEYTIPQEIRLHDLDYAKRVYSSFVEELKRFGITRSIIMTTIHTDSTTILYDELVESGLGAYVGKVCMDMNSLEDALEDTDVSIAESERFILENKDKSSMVKPIITPTLSMICSRKLMTALNEQALEYDLPIQAHLSENKNEIKAVLEHFSDCKDFTETYEKAGMMKNEQTVMAHSIHLSDDEKERLKENNILIAHCPHSNLNLLSGSMKLAEYHDLGLRVGLGSDLAAGHTLNMFSTMVSAIHQGGSHFAHDRYSRPVLAPEAFYTATKGGGSFFGKVGSFEPGYEFDALVIDDSKALEFNDFSLEERAERMIYASDDRQIKNMFVAGKEITNR